jgi:hypothetical protein
MDTKTVRRGAAMLALGIALSGCIIYDPGPGYYGPGYGYPPVYGLGFGFF